MMELRLDLFIGGRQAQPQLQTVQPVVMYLDRVPLAFRMHDAPARDHQVDLPRLDHEFVAERIAVQHFTLEQVGNGRQVDVRMRPYIDPLSGWKYGRSHVIEEGPGADHGLPGAGQGAPYQEAAEVMFFGGDHQLNGGAVTRPVLRFVDDAGLNAHRDY